MDRILEMSLRARVGIFLAVVLFLFGLVVWGWVSDSNADAAEVAATSQQRNSPPNPAPTPPPAQATPEPDRGEDEDPVPDDAPGTAVPGEDPDVPELGGLTDMELPVTQDDLEDAVAVADLFMTNYLSYSWDTPAEEWAESVRELTTTDLYGQTAGGYPDGPLLEQMVEEKRQTAADVQVPRVGMLSKDSIMLEVEATVLTTTTDGITEANYTNQITMTRVSAGWRVSSVYPAGTGDGGYIDPESRTGVSGNQPDDTEQDDTEPDNTEGDGTDA